MNPYDRRVEARENRIHGVSADFGLRGWNGVVDTPRESPITMNDLEAMVHQAKHRGRREALETIPQTVNDARREAWDEGHVAGVDEGRDDLLKRIAAQFERRVDEAVNDGGAALFQFHKDQRHASKADLAEQLRIAVGVLDDLRKEHHNRFGTLPF